MDEISAFHDIDATSPTLSARLHELAAYLAAPTAGRLTEEQRAVSLGIARRLILDVAARLRTDFDTAALWRDWLNGGIPGAERLAALCFARCEEHRWREQPAQRDGAPQTPVDQPGDDPADDQAIITGGPLSDSESAYLKLQIADRRRFDRLGNPCIAIADLDSEIFRALLLDIAAWQLVQSDQNSALAANLGDAVREALVHQSGDAGIDGAARAYHDVVTAEGRIQEAAASAIARHDWPALIALAAVAHRRAYGDMALALLTAETAALPPLLAPLRIGRSELAPLEASLAMVPARAVWASLSDENGR